MPATFDIYSVYGHNHKDYTDITHPISHEISDCLHMSQEIMDIKTPKGFKLYQKLIRKAESKGYTRISYYKNDTLVSNQHIISTVNP